MIITTACRRVFYTESTKIQGYQASNLTMLTSTTPLLANDAAAAATLASMCRGSANTRT